MKAIQNLPESELEIMLVLWQHTQPLRTSAILEQVNQSKSWTLPTLKVLLGRLEQKGCVQCSREGRFALYQAQVPQSAYRKKETKGVLQRFYQNNAKRMIASLVNEEGLTQADLDEIAELIRKAGEKHAE